MLEKKQTYYFLLSGVILLTLIFFYIGKDTISGDHYTYLHYINGIKTGRYSYWYFLEDYVPDTFRNPGYPYFLFLLSLVTEDDLLIRIVQLFLMLAALSLMLKVIELYENSVLLKNVFLLLVIINFVVLTYPAYIYPESLMIFLVTLILYFELKGNFTWKKIIVLSLLYGFTFQVRPVIIFIPFLRFLYFLFRTKHHALVKNLAFIFLFVLTMLPYGFWNYRHHGEFKITPVEGGAGAMYLGYWSPKMINHLEDRYWRNVMYRDLLFNFTEEEEVPHNIQRFNNEWDSVMRVCSKYLTAADTLHLEQMKKYPDLFVTYNSKFTIEREKILKELGVKHYLEEPLYSFKLKAYTFFRLWYTGLWMKGSIRESFQAPVQLIAAYLSTFSTLVIFIGYFLYCAIKRRDILKKILLPLLLCLYFDVFHLPFVIQARYTIPVRLLYLFSLAFMICRIHFKEKKYEL